MRALGRNCRLTISHDGNAYPIPFYLETLRAEPIIERHEALIGQGGPPEAFPRGGKVTGCFTSPLSRSTAPLLLYLCLGQRSQALHVPETRGLFYRDLSLRTTDKDMPRFSIRMDREVERIEYQDLRVRGFELRGSLGNALLLRVDVHGLSWRADPDHEPHQKPAYEEPFDYSSGDVQLDGMAGNSCYEFGLTLSSEENEPRPRNLQLSLHAVLDDGMAGLAETDQHAVHMQFRSMDDEYEANRKAGFELELTRMLMRREQKEADSPDEILSPYLFSVHGDVKARVYEGRPA
jgi:hypothetical protein